MAGELTPLCKWLVGINLAAIQLCKTKFPVRHVVLQILLDWTLKMQCRSALSAAYCD